MTSTDLPSGVTCTWRRTGPPELSEFRPSPCSINGKEDGLLENDSLDPDSLEDSESDVEIEFCDAILAGREAMAEETLLLLRLELAVELMEVFDVMESVERRRLGPLE